VPVLLLVARRVLVILGLLDEVRICRRYFVSF
jgi:hypothetical protein